MRKSAASMFFILGLSFAAAQPAMQMSLLQAGLVVGRDVFARRCPQYIAIADKAKHDAELNYVKANLPPAAGENSYAAMRGRMEAAFNGKEACERELKKHKAQTYATYTYSNVIIKK
jgi:hypothetical protein